EPSSLRIRVGSIAINPAQPIKKRCHFGGGSNPDVHNSGNLIKSGSHSLIIPIGKNNDQQFSLRITINNIMESRAFTRMEPAGGTICFASDKPAIAIPYAVFYRYWWRKNTIRQFT